MVSYYEDENLCSQYVTDVKLSFGSKRKKLLKELCKFKTAAADEFWREKIRDESYLPYIMMCRSNEFSDYLANRLNDLLERLISGMNPSDAVNEAYFLLHTCLFKESDKLFAAYGRLASKYKLITDMGIGWASDDIISEKSQPDFLYARYLLERDIDAESSFFSFLTDTLILTMSYAIMLDKDSETVTDKVKRLYEDYPDVFASAGFFAYFIKDNYAAYDKFSYLMKDPVDYPKLMWVLDGLDYADGKYAQGSPTAFFAPDNEKVHFTIDIDDLDIRWYEFLAYKTLSDTESFTVSDPFFIPLFCRKFSAQLFGMINPENEQAMKICSDYFKKSAVIAANQVDFAGLRVCGLIENDEDIIQLCMDIAKRICEGKQRYCYMSLFKFFNDTDPETVAEALSQVTAYIEENEHSEVLAEQREAFLTEAHNYLNGESSAFTPDPHR